MLFERHVLPRNLMVCSFFRPSSLSYSAEVFSVSVCEERYSSYVNTCKGCL